MAYATLQDLIDRYGAGELTALTDRTGAGAPDPAVAQPALDDASAVIDSYLANTYRLPLSPVPATALRWCCEIARYLLTSIGEMPDDIKARRDAAMRELRDAGAGVLALEAAAVETVRSEPAAVETVPRPRGLGGRGWAGF